MLKDHSQLYQLRCLALSRFSLCTGLALCLASSAALAQLTVIKDYGDTRPSGVPTFEEVERLAKEMKVDVSEIGAMSPYSFPIESQNVRFGELPQPYKHGKKGLIPFFIVGADLDSKQWMQDNKDFLLKHGIRRGLVTNVRNAAALKEMTDAAHPLMLYAMNVDEVAQVLNFNVYPIVVMEEEIAQ